MCPDTTGVGLPRFFTVSQVAIHLAVSTKTVRRWISSGDLRVHRFGRQLRISETDLQAFIHDRG